MKLSGHIEEGKISYKAVDPRCDIHVRELNRHKAARRLITSNKRKVSSAGLVVPSPPNISAGALVEIDLSFPGVPLIYRSRGVVDWMDGAAGKMGVLVFGMDKVDPNAIPESPVQEMKRPETPLAQESVSTTQTEVSSPQAVAQKPAKAEPEETPAVDNTQKGPGMTMPDDEDVAELFSGLVDAEVVVRSGDAKPLKAKRFAVIGEYQNDDGASVLLMAADIALVNFLGSALVMLPKAEAESANKNNTISEEIQESFQEICNISSSLINDAGNAHVRFASMHLSQRGSIPENINAIISNHSNKIDFDIQIPGYGSGRLCFLDGTWK
ncbi:MAG: hypothetical protein JXR76_01130 [Deltaproteobacteria bacterium]|nr:hypothetical protein [Deltaproteobacteria bacterium]